MKDALEYLDTLSEAGSGDAGLQRELASAYERVGDVQGSSSRANLGNYKGALASHRKALAIRARLAAGPGLPGRARAQPRRARGAVAGHGRPSRRARALPAGVRHPRHPPARERREPARPRGPVDALRQGPGGEWPARQGHREPQEGDRADAGPVGRGPARPGTEARPRLCEDCPRRCAHGCGRPAGGPGVPARGLRPARAPGVSDERAVATRPQHGLRPDLRRTDEDGRQARGARDRAQGPRDQRGARERRPGERPRGARPVHRLLQDRLSPGRPR